MSFTVVTLPEAEANFETIFAYIVDRSQRGAYAWANAFDDAFRKLAVNPSVYGLAPESSEVDLDVHQLVFKTRRGNPYRLLYTVRGDHVFVMAIRGFYQDHADNLSDIELPE